MKKNNLENKEKKTFKEWAEDNKGWLIAGGCAAGLGVLGGLLYALGANKEEVENVLDNVVEFKTAVKESGDSIKQPQYYDMFIRELPDGQQHSPQKALEAEILGISLRPDQTIVDPFVKYRAEEVSA